MKFDLATKIPPKVRAVIYTVLGVVFTIESTLDAFDAGLVAERAQGIAIAVLAALGFSLARSNTPLED